MLPESRHVSPYLRRLEELAFIQDAHWPESLLGRQSLGDADDPIKQIGVLSLASSDETIPFRFELRKSHLTYALARHILARNADQPRPWILFAPYIGKPMGEFLREHGINYVDLQGNCFINLNDKYIAEVQGRTPPKQPPSASGMRAAGYRVLFALLADEHLICEPIRTIAEAAGTSRQPVSDLLARLVEQGMAVRSGRKHRWVDYRRRAALDMWIAGYAVTLRPSLLLGAYTTPHESPDELEAALVSALPEQASWCWGGSAAAHRITKYYRGDRTVIHVDEGTTDWLQRVPAVPSETGELHVLGLPGRLGRDTRNERLAHPLLVYAEMLSEPSERAREAAAELLPAITEGTEGAK